MATSKFSVVRRSNDFSRSTVAIVTCLIAIVWLALASLGSCQTEDFLAIKARAGKGDAKAQSQLGQFYCTPGSDFDFAEAVKWFRKAAEQGLTEAQVALASLYESENFAEALKWYRKAAEQGNADAQMTLALYHEIGMGVAKNPAEAVRWYRKAAEQGDSDAQNALGDYYHRGIGVEKDYTEAVKWFRTSAEQGNGNGQSSLGSCYRDGQGVNKDYVEAYAWFNLAGSSLLSPGQLRQLRNTREASNRRILEGAFYESMNNAGTRGRDALEKLMSPQQVAEAQSRTKELRAQIEVKNKRGGK